MKEKYIFSGIVIVAILVIGVIGYRSLYQGGAAPLYGDSREVPAAPMLTGGYTAPVSVPAVVAPTTQPGTPSTKVQPIVRYTSTGFSPAPLAVSAGDTVVFRNESTAGMWVASAPHPVHTDYPGFDAMRPYAQGESYSFTFTRVGTWKYHNHLNPTHYGSIVVAE
ncbi:hypothetical protein A2524_03875 [Candidatus Wolfebacteria bacterium RIFOXYD12_FULL_48_21]|uniref:EfeO-type cupredoxin-like domain-containing protein n=1 Tax=Candidatus Wolfebacteria bacterium RIFOXYD1_FULL_48_65 TaxID=1802561 RepID=A0A1F8E3W0_9BACT|nr:MAG: hypothetical protein A2524_03875 [Candidatus Wolfebacteria bacterium RIFOXYD12_FULL_48_21]OGM95347.1 MAG: hypothetical protein A2610_02565 [Candidatus Wolfebacteria bacterium RIFOXYD1_FULL_48_65]OGM95927.1 MAG: hypothetical protein A2532_02600 [Candidatus Wolfebacteria bacterium RIFOXYD2_FULL_48_11]